MMDKGLSSTAYGTPQGGRWDTVVSAIAVCENMFELLDQTNPKTGKGMEALNLAASAREIMWKTPAPDFRSLAWKLEQAIYYVDYEGEPDHPLNQVLADLQALIEGAH